MDVMVTRMTEEIGENEKASMLHRGAPPSGTTCKYWINGNCMYGDQCRNLHSWSDNVLKEDNPRPKRLVWWTPPPRGFVKINCDGAFTVHGNKAAAGGVVRDWEDKFIYGFSLALGNCSVLQAELWAIKIGMQTAISRGYNNLIVESDSLAAVQIVNAAVQQSQPLRDVILTSIGHMVRYVDCICWNHVFREINSVADGLAKHGLSLSHDLGTKFFEIPPYFIEIPLSLDIAGKIYLR